MSIVIRDVLVDFNSGATFFNHLADHVTLEFPYGAVLGAPTRIEGKTAVTRHLAGLQRAGLTLAEPDSITELKDGGHLAEYMGRYPDGKGNTVDSLLVSRIEHAHGLITLIREFWNTKQLHDIAAGD